MRKMEPQNENDLFFVCSLIVACIMKIQAIYMHAIKKIKYYKNQLKKLKIFLDTKTNLV